MCLQVLLEQHHLIALGRPQPFKGKAPSFVGIATDIGVVRKRGQGADAVGAAVGVTRQVQGQELAQRIDIVVEGIEFGARDHVAAFLGDEFGGGLGQVPAHDLRLPQSGGNGLGDLHAGDIAEHAHERQLPVRIEILRQLLQPAREFGIAFDAQLADRRCIVAAEHRQLAQQARERAAHAEVGFAFSIERPDA